ncbi:MAG: ankyrin repeat domain-containing protein [Acidobacteriota bacterium]
MVRSRLLAGACAPFVLFLALSVTAQQAAPPASPVPSPTSAPEPSIHQAARSGDVAAVTRLIERDPALVNARDEHGLTPLGFAVAFGQLEAMKLLIAKGADVNARDPRGISLFHVAVWRGRAEACRLLMEKGADVTEPGPAGMTPLHITVLSGLTDVARVLLERRSALDLRDLFGNTPLLLAVREGADDMARLLIEAGADVNAASPVTGDAPLDVATARGNAALADALRARGAKPSGTVAGPPRGAYLGQRPPGEAPEIFRPNLVSTERTELNAVFSPDGTEFYFATASEIGQHMRVVRQVDGVWGRPEPVPFAGEFTGVDMMFSPDGARLYYCTHRPLEAGGAVPKDSDIWFVARTAQGWGEPANPGPAVNSPADDYYPTFTTNGDMYFSSKREGGKGGNDIYRARFVNGTFERAENLGPVINTEKWEYDPFIAPDGSYLIFASSRPGGLGQSDLYVSFRAADGSWSEPRNLGAPINTAGPDYTPVVTRDGKYLFYTSGPTGPDDIYWVDAKVIERLRPGRS